MQYNEILAFWFKELSKEQWYKKDDDLDRHIRDRHTTIVDTAAAGETYTWRENSYGRLAEIIVLDQFSRNIYRDTANAFSQDGMALLLAQEAVKLPSYADLNDDEKMFTCMPFMHSESLLIHQQSIKLFSDIKGPALDFAHKHKVIIDRFGRYPHRNKILGRESTEEEVEFLKGPDSSF